MPLGHHPSLQIYFTDTASYSQYLLLNYLTVLASLNLKKSKNTKQTAIPYAIEVTNNTNSSAQVFTDHFFNVKYTSRLPSLFTCIHHILQIQPRL